MFVACKVLIILQITNFFSLFFCIIAQFRLKESQNFIFEKDKIIKNNTNTISVIENKIINLKKTIIFQKDELEKIKIWIGLNEKVNEIYTIKGKLKSAYFSDYNPCNIWSIEFESDLNINKEFKDISNEASNIITKSYEGDEETGEPGYTGVRKELVGKIFEITYKVTECQSEFAEPGKHIVRIITKLVQLN